MASHMPIDFTMTAMCRPEILTSTLESFQASLLGAHMRESILWMNIDPLPDPEFRDRMIFVARKYFKFVHSNQPEEASFPAAVKWCWSQQETEYFFHLEDDWVLQRPFSMEDLIVTLCVNPELSCVNLRAYVWDEMDTRICLSPGLLRTAHAKIMASRLTLGTNPEKQLRTTTPENPIGNRHEGFIGACVPATPILKDIGRAWLHTTNYEKNNGAHFTKWRKK